MTYEEQVAATLDSVDRLLTLEQMVDEAEELVALVHIGSDSEQRSAWDESQHPRGAAWDESKHPRDPEGTSTGGQWTGDGADKSKSDTKPGSAANTKPASPGQAHLVGAHTMAAAAWKKKAAELYKTDKEFAAAVDAATAFTQGQYDMIKVAELDRDGTVPLGEFGQRQKETGRLDLPIGSLGTGGDVVKSFVKGSTFEEADATTRAKSGATVREASRALHAAVDSAPVFDQPIYRGIQLTVSGASDFGSKKTGDLIDIKAVTSFSLDDKIATKFASGKGPGQSRLGDSYGVVFKIVGARALSLAHLSPYKQKEFITRGKFRIKSIDSDIFRSRLAVFTLEPIE